jgi:hypothetical protein
MADDSDVQDLGTAISPQEAQLRQQSGGYGPDGKPAPQMAMVDTQGGSAPVQQPIRSLSEVDAGITGAPSPTGQKQPPLLPHQPNISGSTIEGLQRAADRMGVDSSKIPKEYWPYLQQKYQAAYDPSTMDAVRNWVNATGVGRFMAGWDSQGPQDVVPPDTMAKIHPGIAEMQKADALFNQNIQARIVEKGKYISADGINYTPPDSDYYKVGRLIGSVMANPASAAGLPAVAKAAFGQAMTVGAKAAQTMGAFAAANPKAAQMVGELAKYSALGLLFKNFFGSGGGGAPPP